MAEAAKPADGAESIQGVDNAAPESASDKTEKTEEQIRAEVEKEFESLLDKRVTEATKKRDKYWQERAAKEKMSEDERKAAEEQERLASQARKDRELTLRGLRLDVVDAVAELGLDAGFRKLIAVDDLADIADEAQRKEKLTQRIKDTKAIFDDAVGKAVEKAKQEFLKGKTPPSGDKKPAADADRYIQYKKAGNVRGMVDEKLNALWEKANNGG